MKETYFKGGWEHLKVGAELMVKSVWHSVENHPACTALIVSMVLNVVLFVTMAEARVERDHYNQEAVKAENSRDSLEVMCPYWKGKKN